MNTIERIGNLITRMDSQVVDLESELTPEEKREAKVWNPVLRLWSKELGEIQRELRFVKGVVLEKL